MGKIFKVGLVGCGHIAETYFRAHKYFNNFKIIKCADINKFAAQRCAKTYKISSVSVNELLKDCLLYKSPSPRDRQKSRIPACD